jgi:hypothetical protein
LRVRDLQGPRSQVCTVRGGRFFASLSAPTGLRVSGAVRMPEKALGGNLHRANKNADSRVSVFIKRPGLTGTMGLLAPDAFVRDLGWCPFSARAVGTPTRQGRQRSRAGFSPRRLAAGLRGSASRKRVPRRERFDPPLVLPAPDGLRTNPTTVFLRRNGFVPVLSQQEQFKATLFRGQGGVQASRGRINSPAASLRMLNAPAHFSKGALVHPLDVCSRSRNETTRRS